MSVDVDSIKLGDSSGGWDKCNETWRKDRLNQVIGYLYAKGVVLEKIHGLQDCKGNLTVVWKTKPNTFDTAILSEAWSSDVGDPGSAVDHLMVTEI